MVHAASALESLTQRDMNDNAELPNPILHSSTQTALTTSIHRNVTDGVHADAVEGDDSEGTRTSIPVSGPSNSSAIRRSPSGMNNTGHTNTSLVDTMSSLRRSQGIISSYLPSRSSPGVLARTHLPVSLSEQRIRETKRLAAFTSSPQKRRRLSGSLPVAGPSHHTEPAEAAPFRNAPIASKSVRSKPDIGALEFRSPSPSSDVFGPVPSTKQAKPRISRTTGSGRTNLFTNQTVVSKRKLDGTAARLTTKSSPTTSNESSRPSSKPIASSSRNALPSNQPKKEPPISMRSTAQPAARAGTSGDSIRLSSSSRVVGETTVQGRSQLAKVPKTLSSTSRVLPLRTAGHTSTADHTNPESKNSGITQSERRATTIQVSSNARTSTATDPGVSGNITIGQKRGRSGLEEALAPRKYQKISSSSRATTSSAASSSSVNQGTSNKSTIPAVNSSLQNIPILDLTRFPSKTKKRSARARLSGSFNVDPPTSATPPAAIRNTEPIALPAVAAPAPIGGPVNRRGLLTWADLRDIAAHVRDLRRADAAR